MTSIGSFIPASSPAVLEKSVADLNNVDEGTYNARDLGYVRLNYARLGAVGKLAADFDSEDNYKISLQNNGNLSLSFMSPKEESPVDFSKYDDFYKELLLETDPEAYEELIAKEQEEEANEKLIAYTAPGLKVEVYTLDKYGREQLIGDSSLEDGDELRENFDAMLTGEYQATKGDYYIKVTRDDTVDADEEISYVMQASMGDSFKYDYVATETLSQDTQNKTETRLTAELQSYLYGENAISAQATANQSVAQMLEIGYLGVANLYSNNSQWWRN